MINTYDAGRRHPSITTLIRLLAGSSVTVHRRDQPTTLSAGFSLVETPDLESTNICSYPRREWLA